MTLIKKLVAIGPESTGKSTLCEKLALHYDTEWCPEYARIFFENRSPDYVYDDLKEIAKGQLRLEEECTAAVSKTQKSNLLFIDTDLYVIKVWSEFVFQRCDNFILQQIALRKYDGYFLCHPDLPWQEDPLREYPDRKTRDELFYYYKELLQSQSVPWCDIFGNESERMHRAIRFTNQLL